MVEGAIGKGTLRAISKPIIDKIVERDPMFKAVFDTGEQQGENPLTRIVEEARKEDPSFLGPEFVNRNLAMRDRKTLDRGGPPSRAELAAGNAVETLRSHAETVKGRMSRREAENRMRMANFLRRQLGMPPAADPETFRGAR